MKEEKRFEVIECRGTPYEIGYQWGEGCRDNIQEAVAESAGFALFMGTTKGAIIDSAMTYFPAVKEFDPELVELLEGQAAGAGVEFQEVFTLKCGFDIGAYYPYLSNLCTSFAATGKATSYGQTLLGQNIDWIPGTPMSLVKTVQPDGYAQLSLVLWGVVEYTLNSAGYGMCANGTWASVEDFSRRLPIGCYLPKVMRQRSLGDGLSLLEKHARGLGYYHLASAYGQMVGIESLQTDYEIIPPQEDMMVHSNHYLTPRFQGVDMVQTLVPDSLQRIERIKGLMQEQYGYITWKTMGDILSDHDNHPNSICRHVDSSKPPEFASETLASFIMMPQERTMHIACGNPCQYEYMEYTF